MAAYQANNANQSNPKKVCIRLEEAENGWTLSGYAHSDQMDTPGGRDLEYVYSDLDQALKELPGLVSVLKGADKSTMGQMKDDQQMMKMKGGMKHD